MQGRTEYVNELLASIEEMSASIEERESMESDFSIAREIIEQLREEVDYLRT
jgi:hypothetical protein